MKKILIIDDNLTSIIFIRNAILRNFICEIKELNESVNAVNFIKEYNPNLIILDVVMPYVDGIELANQLQDISSNPYIVIVTALNQKTNKLILQDHKKNNIITDYIFKPFTEQDLCNILKPILED